MTKTLDLMHQKIETIGHGLLRLRKGKGHLNVQVSTSKYDGQRLNCIFTESNLMNQLFNRDVVLIQKKGDDFFYITAQVDDEVKKPCKVISLKINKACWFIKKKSGNVAWMQQKYVFESPEKKVS